MLFFVYCLAVFCLAVSLHVLAELTVRRVGGLFHWRCGPVGGSFYVARKAAR